MSYILRRPLKFDEISIFHLKLLSSVEKSLNILSYFLAFSEYLYELAGVINIITR